MAWSQPIKKETVVVLVKWAKENTIGYDNDDGKIGYPHILLARQMRICLSTSTSLMLLGYGDSSNSCYLVYPQQAR